MPEVDLDKTKLLEPPLTPNGEWLKCDGTAREVYRSRSVRDEWDVVTVEAAESGGVAAELELTLPAIDLATGVLGTTTITLTLAVDQGVHVALDRVTMGAGQQILARETAGNVVVRVSVEAYRKAKWLSE